MVEAWAQKDVWIKILFFELVCYLPGTRFPDVGFYTLGFGNFCYLRKQVRPFQAFPW